MFVGPLLRLLNNTNDQWIEADERLEPAVWERTRIWSLALLLLGPHIPRLRAVAELPEQLLDPDWRLPAGFLASAPAWLLVFISLSTVGALSMALAGVNVRAFGLIAAGLLIVGNSIMYSVAGKIVHHQWTLIAVVIFAPTYWSGSKRLFGTISPRLALAWIVGWGLLSSAISKVRGGWLDTSYSVVRAELDVQAALQGVFAPANRLDVDFAGSAVLWELADYATVFMEFGLLLALLRPTFFRWSICLMITFHISVYLLLGISFVAILPAYVPFLAEYLPQQSRRPRYGPFVAATLGLFAGWTVLVSVPDGTGWILSITQLPVTSPSGLTFALFAGFFAFSAVRSLRRPAADQ